MSARGTCLLKKMGRDYKVLTYARRKGAQDTATAWGAIEKTALPIATLNLVAWHFEENGLRRELSISIRTCNVDVVFELFRCASGSDFLWQLNA